MRTLRTAFVLAWLAVAANSAVAAGFTQEFSNNPAHDGWAVHGDASLFSWNAANGWLDVTWDSSRTNSYFHRPLGTVLTKDDDFTLAFDIWLNDIEAGVNPAKPYTFQIAVALLDLSQAVRPGLFAGSGVNASTGLRSTVEFNYFPDTELVAETISLIAVSTNNSSFAQFKFSHDFPRALDVGVWHRITLAYTASNRSLTMTKLRAGAPHGTVQTVSLGGTFTDIRCDTVAIASYNDGGQTVPANSGSVLAHGRVDNIAVTTPVPPVTQPAQSLDASGHHVTFLSRSNWLYTLLRSETLTNWTALDATTTGNGSTLMLTDTNPPAARAFYRVRAERP
jgi:hypothetical protein